MSGAAPISFQDSDTNSDTDSDMSNRGYFVNSDEVARVDAGTEDGGTIDLAIITYGAPISLLSLL
jgi:hypothetical protein